MTYLKYSALYPAYFRKKKGRLILKIEYSFRRLSLQLFLMEAVRNIGIALTSEVLLF